VTLAAVVSGFLALVYLCVLAAIVIVLVAVLFGGWSPWWVLLAVVSAVTLRWAVGWTWPELGE
jgi:uncharacterized membrane protein